MNAILDGILSAFSKELGGVRASLSIIIGPFPGFRKCTALFTLACFLFSFIFTPSLMAVNEIRIDAARTRAALADPVIPPGYGSITDIRNYGSEQAVVIIQDLHCHEEVQKNISRILKSLDDKYGLPEVFVEGGYGKIDTSWLCGVSDRKLRGKLIESLLEQGRLTGSELYSVNAQRPDMLRGLDDEALHKENIRRLAALMEKKAGYQDRINELAADLRTMKLRYFNVRNREFDELVEKYRAGRISGERYYAHLFRLAGKINADPGRFNAIFRIELSEYPNMALYLEMSGTAGKIRYKKVSRELQAFLRELKARLPYSAYNALLAKTDDLSNSGELYGSLLKLTKAYDIRYERSYPELAAFLAYVEKSRRINPIRLINEERALTKEIRAGLSCNTGELEVSFLSDFFGSFQNYLLGSLSADDYAYFKEKFASFRILWDKYAFSDRMSGMEADFRFLTEYFDVNCSRNTVFVKNLDLGEERTAADVPGRNGLTELSEMLGRSRLKVIVTGGFHSDGLRKYLDERKITCITVTPNITRGTEGSTRLYEELMKRQAVFGAQALAPVMESIEMAGGHIVVDQGKVNVVFHKENNEQLIETIATFRNGKVEINDAALRDMVRENRATQKEYEQIVNGLRTAGLMAVRVAKAVAGMAHPASAPEQVVRALMKILVALPDTGDSYGLMWETANDGRMQQIIEGAAGLTPEELSGKSDLAQKLISTFALEMAATGSMPSPRQTVKDKFIAAVSAAFAALKGRGTVITVDASDDRTASNDAFLTGKEGTPPNSSLGSEAAAAGADGKTGQAGSSKEPGDTQTVRPYKMKLQTTVGLIAMASSLSDGKDRLAEYFGGPDVIEELEAFNERIEYATELGAQKYELELQLTDKEIAVVEQLPRLQRLFFDLVEKNGSLNAALDAPGRGKNAGSSGRGDGLTEIRKFLSGRENHDAFISFIEKLTAGTSARMQDDEREALEVRKRKEAAGRFNDELTFDEGSGLLYRPSHTLKEVNSFNVSNEMNYYETDPDTEAQREEVDVFLGYGSNNVWDYAMRRNAKTMIIAEISEKSLRTQEFLYKPLLLSSENPAQFLSMLAAVPLKGMQDGHPAADITDAQQAFAFIDEHRYGIPQQRRKYAEEIRARVLETMTRHFGNSGKIKAEVYADYVYHYLVTTIDAEYASRKKWGLYSHFADRYRIPPAELLKYRIRESLVYRHESEFYDIHHVPADNDPGVTAAARQYTGNMRKKNFSVMASQEAFDWLKNIFAAGNVKYILTDINEPEEAYAAVSGYLGPARNVNGLFFTNIVDVELRDSGEGVPYGVYAFDVRSGQDHYLPRVRKHISDALQYLPGPAGRSLTAYSVRLEREKHGHQRSLRLPGKKYKYLKDFGFFYETIDVGGKEPLEEAVEKNRSYNLSPAEMADTARQEKELPRAAILNKNLPWIGLLAQRGFGSGMIASAIAALEYTRSMFHPRGFIGDHGKNDAGARKVVHASYLVWAATTFIYGIAGLLSAGLAVPLMQVAMMGAAAFAAGFAAASAANIIRHTDIDRIYLKDEGIVDAVRRFGGTDGKIRRGDNGHLRLAVPRHNAPGEWELMNTGLKDREGRPIWVSVELKDGQHGIVIHRAAGQDTREINDILRAAAEGDPEQLARRLGLPESARLVPGIMIEHDDTVPAVTMFTDVQELFTRLAHSAGYVNKEKGISGITALLRSLFLEPVMPAMSLIDIKTLVRTLTRGGDKERAMAEVEPEESGQGTVPYEVERKTVAELSLMVNILLGTHGRLTDYFGGRVVLRAMKSFYDKVIYASESGANNYNVELQLTDKEIEAAERLTWVQDLFNNFVVQNKDLVIDLTTSFWGKTDHSAIRDSGLPEIRKYLTDRDNQEAVISLFDKLAAAFDALARYYELESVSIRQRKMEGDRFFNNFTFTDRSRLLYRSEIRGDDARSFNVSNEMNFYESDPDSDAHREEVDVFLGYGSNNVWDYAMRRNAKAMVIAEISEESLKTQEYLHKPLLLISENPAQFLSLLAAVPLPADITDAQQAFEFINKNRLRMPKEQRLAYATEVRSRVLDAMYRHLENTDKMKAAVYADYVYHTIVNVIDFEDDPDASMSLYDYFAFRYEIPEMELLEYRITEQRMYRQETKPFDPYYSPDEKPDVTATARNYIENMQKKNYSVLASQEAFDWLKNIFAAENVKYILTNINDPEEAYAAVSRYLGPHRNVNGLFFSNIIDIELAGEPQFSARGARSGIYAFDVMSDQRYYLERVAKHIRDARQYLPGPAGRSLTAYSVRLEREADGSRRSFRLKHKEYSYLEGLGFFYETIDVGDSEPVEEAVANNRSYNPTLAEMDDKIRTEDEGSAMAAILTKNLPKINWLAQLGFGSGMIASAIAALEYTRSMLHPRGFIGDHGKNDAGARKVVYSSYFVGAATAFVFAAAGLLSMGFAAPVVHLVLSGAASLAAGFLAASVADIGVHTYVDWIYLKDEGIVDAIRRFGGADSKIRRGEDGHLKMIVTRLNDPDEWELMNTGLKDGNGRPVWVSVKLKDEQNTIILHRADGQDPQEIKDIVSAAIEGNSAKLAGRLGLRPDAKLVPGISVDYDDMTPAVKTTADGRKLFTRGYLAQIAGTVSGFINALGLIDREERKNREAALKSVFMDIDADREEEFLKNIDPVIRKMKNSQIVISERLVSAKFGKINELAQSKGVEIYVKVTDSGNREKYEDMGFAGIGIVRNGDMEIVNFSRRDSYAAKIITGYSDAAQLQEKLRGMNQTVVLRISEIHKLMTGRDVLEINAIVNLLGEYISDIAFQAYTRVEIYRAENFSAADLPDGDDIDALIGLLNGRKDARVSNRAVSLHLSNIGQERQKVFIKEIVSRSLMLKALGGTRLNNAAQETLLKEVLWLQRTNKWTAPLPELGSVLGVDLENSEMKMAAIYAAINAKIKEFEKSGAYKTNEAAAGELLVLLLKAERKIDRIETQKQFDEHSVREILAAA